MPDCTEVFKSFFKCGTELKLGGGFSPVVPNLEGPKMIKGMRQKWHKIPGFSQIFAFFCELLIHIFEPLKIPSNATISEEKHSLSGWNAC